MRILSSSGMLEEDKETFWRKSGQELRAIPEGERVKEQAT